VYKTESSPAARSSSCQQSVRLNSARHGSRAVVSNSVFSQANMKPTASKLPKQSFDLVIAADNVGKLGASSSPGSAQFHCDDRTHNRRNC